MPRIFKGSESTLRLLISKTGDYQALTEIKIKLYTTDIENAIEVIDGIEVDDNIATITLAPRAFMGMEDGLINYIIDGATEDDVFHTERQSNYMLKTLSHINEDGVAHQTMTIDTNGEYRITPNDGLYVDINVDVIDTNGSFDDGFNEGHSQGYSNGYDQGRAEGTLEGYGMGKIDGENEQKSKLEYINITENGIYNKEDGYNTIEVNVPDTNGSYDEGYTDGYEEGLEEGVSNAGGVIAETARVLDITENGIYTSMYSNDEDYINPYPPTGDFGNDKYFYDYCYMEYRKYTTNKEFTITRDTEFDIWFEPKDVSWTTKFFRGSNGSLEFGINNLANTKCSFKVLVYGYSATYDYGNDGENEFYKQHHISYSVNKGLWIDGVKRSDFNVPDSFLGYNYNGTLEFNASSEKVYFGMVKIDDMIFIPTENGFLDYNNNTLLDYTDPNSNGMYVYSHIWSEPIKSGELIRTINVNVSPQVDVRKLGLRCTGSVFETVPSALNFNGIEDMHEMFNGCTNLKDADVLRNYDFTNCTNFNSAFKGDRNLENVDFLEDIAYSMNADWSQCFYDCTKLTRIPAIYTNGSTAYQQGCAIWSYQPLALVDFGGFIGLKYSMNRGDCFKKCTSLSHQSLLNILNGLYDFTGNGETPTSNQGQLGFPQTLMDMLSEDDKLIAINKGWTLSVV